MRQHICKRCGKIYLTDKPGSVCCPECAQKAHQDVSRKKICAMCGVEFIGYPRSKYCPTCLPKAKQMQKQQYRKSGTNRKLGSIDFCANCGKEYVVKSGLQKYCPECSNVVVHETIKANKREYVRRNKEKINIKKSESRKDRKVCVICGKAFTSQKPTVTCSPECAKEYKRRKMAIIDVKRGRAHPERIMKKMDRTNPQSGIPGITWHKKTEKWQLKMGKKYIGLFPTVDAAKEEKERIEKNK